MSYQDLLLNTCDIKRFESTGEDAYGNPTGDWNIIHANEKCRHVSGKGREIKIGAEVVIVYDELFLESIDVTEQDKVEINGNTYNILSVTFHQNGNGEHHKKVYMEIVK